MGEQTTISFYQDLAPFYHLIYRDWQIAINEQGRIISNLLSHIEAPVLDCACGVGTQALGLAALGYKMEGSDISVAEIERAKIESEKRGLSINFRVDDMRKLTYAHLNHYGAIVAMDNSLPHLESNEEIIESLAAMKTKLKTNGILLLSIRDYGMLMKEHPLTTPPVFFNDGQFRRIVHQVWDWQNERNYIVHLYITLESEKGWRSHHFLGNYRAISVPELVLLLQGLGYQDIQVFDPKETGYHQPIIKSIKKE